MDYASDSYLTTSLISQERGENGSDSSRRRPKIEDRGRNLSHCNTQSYSLIHYSYVSLQNAAGDVTEALKCINITQSWHGVSGAEHVCAWGVKEAAAGDGGTASPAPDESNSRRQVECVVCALWFVVFQSVLGLVEFTGRGSMHIFVFCVVFVLHVFMSARLSISVCLNMPLWCRYLWPGGYVSAIVCLLARS